MRDLNFKRAVLGLMILTATATWGQRPFYLVSGLHPGYSLVSMRPTTAGFAVGVPNVGAMSWLADGRLFVASMSTNGSGGPTGHMIAASNGYLFSGIPTATTNATVTSTTAGNDFYMPSGALAFGDTIYVLDNKWGLSKLTPNGSGGYTKSLVYQGIIADSSAPLSTNKGKTGWGHRCWNGGMIYKDGYFYVPVGQGLISGDGTTYVVDAGLYRGKGTILKISKDGSTVDTLAGGVRNPVDIEFGPEDEIFYNDNQGSYMPNAALFHVKQGRFFGHPKTPFDNQMRTPPAVIYPYGSASTGGTATDPMVTAVSTGLLTLKPGSRYAGQILVGSNHQTGVNRVFLEKVGGEFQGALFPFSQGFGVGSGSSSSSVAGVLPDFRANVNRMSYGPDGQIYVGGGGSTGGSGAGSHGFDGTNVGGGLARLVPNNDPVFEMKAVRSMSATQMEIEFTEPVVSAATSNFAVRQMGSLQGGDANNQTYGAGRVKTNTALTVSAVSLNTEKTKVTLTITGLVQRPVATVPGSIEDRTWGNTVQINVTGVAAVSGRPMWGDGSGGGVVWYTLNKFGPGVDAGSGVSVNPSSNLFRNVSGLSLTRNAAGITVRAPVAGSYSLRVSDLRGATRASYSTEGDFLIPAATLGAGVTVLEAKTADGQRWISAVPKL